MATKKKALPVLTLSILFAVDGKKYSGVSILNGVGFGIKPAPCSNDRYVVDFTNAKNAPPGLMWDGVTAIDDKSTKVPEGYLVIKPDQPVPLTPEQVALGFTG